jgi:hypothetical protein
MMRINLKDVDISLEVTSGTSNIKGRISGAESATVTISADDSVEYEGGSYLPAEIIDGKVAISGSITKAWLSNDFLKALFHQQENNGGLVTVIKPTFVLTAGVNNSKSPKRRIEITGVKFNSANITGLSIDGHATQDLPFNATGYKFLD